MTWHLQRTAWATWRVRVICYIFETQIWEHFPAHAYSLPFLSFNWSFWFRLLLQIRLSNFPIAIVQLEIDEWKVGCIYIDQQSSERRDTVIHFSLKFDWIFFSRGNKLCGWLVFKINKLRQSSIFSVTNWPQVLGQWNWSWRLKAKETSWSKSRIEKRSALNNSASMLELIQMSENCDWMSIWWPWTTFQDNFFEIS